MPKPNNTSYFLTKKVRLGIQSHKLATFAQVTFLKPIHKVQFQLMHSTGTMDAVLPESKGYSWTAVSQSLPALTVVKKALALEQVVVSTSIASGQQRFILS